MSAYDGLLKYVNEKQMAYNVKITGCVKFELY